MPDNSRQNESPRHVLTPSPSLEKETLFRGSNEFIRTEAGLSDRNLTQAFISELAPLDRIGLERVRLNMAAYLRKYLGQLMQQGFEGVVTSDGICPGLIGAALSGAPDASTYFTGSLVMPSERSMCEFHRVSGKDYTSLSLASEQHRSIFSHLRKRDLPGTLLICANGDVEHPDGGRVTISVGVPMKQRVTTLGLGDMPQQIAPEERRQILQERAAIAALHQTGLWLGRELNKPAIRLRLMHPANLKDLNKVHEHLLLDAIGEARRLNRHVWRRLFAIMQGMQHSGLALGESFTGGLLGNLTTSLPGSSRYVHTVYCFYHSSLKETLEVPRLHLSEGRIGEPETVILAASGMLKHFPGSARTAIATSGWANRHWNRDGDQFSVAVLDRANGRELIASAKVVVAFSRDMEPSQGRKELTRQLGVSTSLYLFAQVLGRGEEALKPALAGTVGGLSRFIDRYARITIEHS